MDLRFLEIGLMRAIFHIPGNVDVTIKLFMINVNGDSKYSGTGFVNDTEILTSLVEESLRSASLHLFISVPVTSRNLKLLDLSFNELMYDRRVPSSCLSLIVQLFC